MPLSTPASREPGSSAEATSSAPPHRYTAQMADAIECRWQKYWESKDTFHALNPGEEGFDSAKPKYYVLDMFPYPSGAGLHVGHPEGYTATDIVARYRRHRGFNVLHPMGWDAFGLPAEQYAIETGVHPAETTKKAIDNFRRQLKRFGFSYDWSREFATIDEDYYRWTQWIWLQAYHSWFDPEANKARPIDELIRELDEGASSQQPEGWLNWGEDERREFIDDHRLAYLSRQTVNWCPMLGTVLANEEVIDGRSERGSHPVFRKPLKQWMFRITAYADRLLEDLDDLDWPHSTRTMQKEWIGRSEGAEIDFQLEGGRFSMVVRLSEPCINKQIIDTPLELKPHLTAEGFAGMDPYPAGEPSPVNLIRHIRTLPHLELEGATYFITWNLLNDGELSPEERDIVYESLLHWNDKKCRVYAGTVMPDHVHWIVKPYEGIKLGDLVSGIKRFTAKTINKLRGCSGSLWQDERFDHIIRDEERLTEFLYYIFHNSVRAELVDKPSAYRWSFVHAGVMEMGGESLCVVHTEVNGTARRAVPPHFIRVYTTRPDTVFGASYMVMAPEHSLLEEILANPAAETDGEAIREYVEKARHRSDVDRMADAKEKTGVFTGWFAVNPATGKRVPIWVADYVLMGYGHGAIMAVPAHDQRDFDFAIAFGLDIVDVVHSKALGAIREGCGRIVQLPEGDEQRMDTLIDFVALCVNWQEDDYNKAWKIATTRRSERSEEDREHPDAESQPRGAIASIWRETLLDFAKGDLDGLIEAAGQWRLVARTGAALTESGRCVNSANDEVSLNGLDIPEAKKTIIEWLEKNGCGRGKVNFKLRDWLFSRQRYWGEPFPVVFDEDGHHHPVDEGKLPVVLPVLDDYTPAVSDTPAPLLAKATEWVQTTAAEVGLEEGMSPDDALIRETNTMPGWAGSCWYFLRYCDPRPRNRSHESGYSERLISRDAERYWMGTGKEGGVDLYIGGAEHAVLHLLYARFWHKMLFDLGEVSTPEPFQKLFHQGMITSHAYQRKDKTLVPVDLVEEGSDGTFMETATGEGVTPVVAKMSKSLKNVINPDVVIEEYGADTFRLYEMAMGPLEQSKPWNTRDIVGVYRFLQRAWRLVVDEETGDLRLGEENDAGVEKRLHKTIDKVGGDIDRLAFNTAIAAMIEFVNYATSSGGLTADQLDRFLVVLSPFAPHMTEELWSKRGYEGTMAFAAWPEVDEGMLREEEVEMPVQILGKVRSRIVVAADADEETVKQMALEDERIKVLLEGKTVRKVIVVAGKIVNIVAN